MRRRATTAVALRRWTADETILRSEAIITLAAVAGGTEGAVKLRIIRAIRTGRLRLARRSPDRFNVGELGAWAVTAWRAHASAIAVVIQPSFSLTICATAPAPTASIRGIMLPGDLAAAHAMISQQDRRIAELEAHCAALQREADALRPDAERYRSFKRKSGRRGQF